MRTLRSSLFNQSGSSLISAVIALVIISFTALTIASYTNFTGAKNQVVGTQSRCNVRAQSVLALFKNADNKLNVLNWHPWSNSGSLMNTPPHYTSGLPVRLPAGETLPATGAISNLTANTWLLIDSGSNWAAALYNQGGYCGQAVAGQPFFGTRIDGIAPFTSGPLQIPAMPINSSEKIYLNLERLSFQNQSVDCGAQGSFKLIPLSPANQTNAANINYGFQVTATVNYTDFEGISRYCQAKTTLKPDADYLAPTFLNSVPGSSVDPAPGTCPGPTTGTSACDCGGTSQLCLSSHVAGGGPLLQMNISSGTAQVCMDNNNSVDVDIGMLSNEAGSLFACDIDMSPTGAPTFSNNFQVCNSISTAFGTFAATQTTYLSSTQTTGIKLTGSNMPLGNYLLSAKVIDTGQNMSPVIQKNIQVVDGCPVSYTDSQCPAGTSIPDQCGNPNSCTATCGSISSVGGGCVQGISYNDMIIDSSGNYSCPSHAGMTFVYGMFTTPYATTLYSDSACTSALSNYQLVAISASQSGSIQMGTIAGNGGYAINAFNAYSCTQITSGTYSGQYFTQPSGSGFTSATSSCLWCH